MTVKGEMFGLRIINIKSRPGVNITTNFAKIDSGTLHLRFKGVKITLAFTHGGGCDDDAPQESHYI